MIQTKSYKLLIAFLKFLGRAATGYFFCLYFSFFAFYNEPSWWPDFRRNIVGYTWLIIFGVYGFYRLFIDIRKIFRGEREVTDEKLEQ